MGTGPGAAVHLPSCSSLAGVALLFFTLPIVGLAQRAPWSQLWSQLHAPATLDALRLSLVCSLGATALAIVFGLPLAWVLARVDFPGRGLARAVVLLPMVLPPVVGGVALFLAFGRRGLVGQYLDSWFGIRLPFTTLGAVIAEAFVAMPFFVVAVEAGLRSFDERFEDAAATLGARRWRDVPAGHPAADRAVARRGRGLCWARALGEFGATITFAGNLQGKTQTMPLGDLPGLRDRTPPRASC